MLLLANHQELPGLTRDLVVQCSQPAAERFQCAGIVQRRIQLLGSPDRFQSTQLIGEPGAGAQSLGRRAHGQGMTTAGHRLHTAGPDLGDDFPDPVFLVETGAGVYVPQQPGQLVPVAASALPLNTR